MAGKKQVCVVVFDNKEVLDLEFTTFRILASEIPHFSDDCEFEDATWGTFKNSDGENVYEFFPKVIAGKSQIENMINSISNVLEDSFVTYDEQFEVSDNYPRDILIIPGDIRHTNREGNIDSNPRYFMPTNRQLGLLEKLAREIYIGFAELHDIRVKGQLLDESTAYAFGSEITTEIKNTGTFTIKANHPAKLPRGLHNPHFHLTKVSKP